MLRDLGDPLAAALDECRRVLRDDGRLLLSAMTPAYPQSLYFASAARQAADGQDMELAGELLRLDRGRSVFCQRQLTVEQWDELLAPHGLTIDAVRPITGALAMRFWDVGLRPFTATLLRCGTRWVQTGALGQVKALAIPLMHRLFGPLLERLHDGVACMHLLSVRKR